MVAARQQPPLQTKPRTTLIDLPELRLGILELVIIGDSPLISHKWSEKAKKMLLDKQMKKAKQGREAKDPEKDFRDSLYEHPDGGFGFPTIAFKAAAVGACRFVDGVKMTEARGAFHVLEEVAQIDGTPTIREDMVRVSNGNADIRYRGEFKKWRTRITVRYNKNALSEEQIVNLFNTAGFGVGVGEWRPEKDGSFGMFHVATENELGIARPRGVNRGREKDGVPMASGDIRSRKPGRPAGSRRAPRST